MTPVSCSPCWHLRTVKFSPDHVDLVADMGGLGISTLGRADPRLAAALRASPVPFVLMLDYLH